MHTTTKSVGLTVFINEEADRLLLAFYAAFVALIGSPNVPEEVKTAIKYLYNSVASRINNQALQQQPAPLSGWQMTNVPSQHQRRAFDDLFSITVGDDALTDMGILAGDDVLCERANEIAYYGQLCAVQTPHGLLLRQVINEDGLLRLECPNSKAPTLLLTRQQAQIKGVAILVERDLEAFANRQSANARDEWQM